MSYERAMHLTRQETVPPFLSQEAEGVVIVEGQDIDMKIGSIVIRCFEFDKMAEFWREALHYELREPAESGWVVLRDPTGCGPNLSLDQVFERRTGKRSRLHIDLYANDREMEVERLLSIGATRYLWRYCTGDDFVVLADPDDNLFCVVQMPQSASR